MAAIDAIPSRLLVQPARLAMAAGQERLARAQAEAASGRHQDIGLTLGATTGADIGLRVQLSGVEQTLDTAEQAALKAETTQTSLSAMSGIADRFRTALTGARGAENGRNLSASSGLASLQSLHDALSVTYDGQYLFGGLASDTAPLTAYEAGPRQAVTDAFEAQFGFPPDDPAAAGLTAAQLKGFLDGPFDALFTGAGWTATWSPATDTRPGFRPGSGTALDLSATANAPFAQELAKSFAMIEILGGSKINAAAFVAVSDKALATVSEAQGEIGGEQARIGIGQDRLKEVQSSLAQRRTTLTSAVSALESVDPYEAATRVNLLMNQLESAYALTGRISRLSLLNYL